MNQNGNRPSPESLLAKLGDGEQAQLRVYIGAAPGVGKTYQMLEDAHLLKKQGADIVVAAVEFHGECLRRHDDRVRRARCPETVLPGLRGKGGVVVIARASRGIPADVEPWIALVLVVKRSGSRPNRPLRAWAPRDSDSGCNVVVVAMYEAVPEASILSERDVGPTDL